MINRLTKKLLLSSTLAVTLSFMIPSVAMAGSGIESIIKDGNLFGEMRYRYETVDQDGIANKAAASTIRNNIGFKTGEYKDVSALLEAQFVNTLGASDFNSSTNGNTSYPLVVDPKTSQINRAFLKYTGIPETEIVLGRQGINLANQRFIGTVGWRQNDQTFDSVFLTNSSIEDLSLSLSYIWGINRIQGRDHSLGDLSTDAYLANVNYTFSDALKLSTYAYLLDIDLLPSSSSETYGLRLTGNIKLSDDWTVSYEAEAARQSDYGDNTNSYNENYYHISPALKGHGFTLQAGYELLGGDGTNSFQTPLATGHKFNGWADKFLSTPDNGLEDTYGKVAYKFSGTDSLADGISLAAIYHDFKGDESADYGDELDLSITRAFTVPDFDLIKGGKIVLKYADYKAEDGSYTDTKKLWLQIGVKF